jgi:two-component system nitrogen regulation sensor histidine kinase NtrY
MTTREKGTGLGLAIVRRIVEEHDGAISLDDAPAVASGGHGARIRIEFPMRETGVAAPDEAAAAESDKVKETEST